MSDEPQFLEDEPTLFHLHKTALLEAFAQLRANTSNATLRAEVRQLRARLTTPQSGLHAREDDPDATTFEHAYLVGELHQVEAALTLERAQYYIDRLIKSVSAKRTSAINDINLNRWKTYDDIQTDSWWPIDRRDKTGVHSAEYWGNFVPQIPRQMMQRYTKRGDWVLDTFAGSGTTLIEAQRLGRNALGIELQSAVAEQTRARIATEPNAANVIADVVTNDSTTVDFARELARHGQRSVQLVIMHPPYFDIINFSNDARDLSNASSVEAFLQQMSTIAAHAAAVLDKGRYLVLVIGDKYAQGEWIPLGFRTMDVVLNQGFLLKSIVVKNFDATTGKRGQKELWKYRALVGGFYVFKHEYLFIFKKR